MSSVVVAMILAPVIAAAQAPSGQGQGQQQIQQIQQQRAPARDPSSPVKKGTAVLRGKVLNPEGRPLRRVQIRLSGESIPEGRTASTNGLGKWEIRELPAGRVLLAASRAGYLSAQLGQKHFGEPGRPIELGDGETVENLDLTLTHNAVITGHIYDEAGEPLAGANVMPMQLRFFNGRRRLTPTRGNALSDDSGQYRLGGLEPGEYYIYASSRETWETDPPDVKSMGFMPTMYPAATAVVEAQRVRVKPGQEAAGIDIALVPGKTATVSGTAVNSQGLPLAGEMVSLGVEIRGENFSSFFGGAGVRVNPDGTFVMRNVAPGEYHATVRATPSDRPPEGANVIINVAGADVDGVNIVTSAAGAVTGRVVVDPGAPLPIPLSRLVVRAMPADRDTTINAGSAPENGHVREDGSFELRSIFGANRLTVGPLPEGWAIRQIDQNGRDLAGQAVDPQGQTLDGATVVLTSRFPTLTAALHDDKGTPTLDGIFILFPEDSTLWVEDLRLIRTGRPGQTGEIVLRAVRPGSYLAAAVPGVVSSQWNDPEYLESLRTQARRVSVDEGGSAHVDVAVKAPGG